MNPVRKTFKYGDHTVTLETGRIARQATGAVLVTMDQTTVLVTVVGGGVNGQAGACAHGLSRALAQVDPGNHEVLRANGLLTRDPRMVERKKYGQRGARRRFQFSKR